MLLYKINFITPLPAKTAAEIIYFKADSSKPKMGLTTYKNAPEGRVLKSDTSIAKNYLEEKEIKNNWNVP